MASFSAAILWFGTANFQAGVRLYDQLLTLSVLTRVVTNGGFDNATLIDILVNHVTQTVTHYKGRCHHWDVVNEREYP